MAFLSFVRSRARPSVHLHISPLLCEDSGQEEPVWKYGSRLRKSEFDPTDRPNSPYVARVVSVRMRVDVDLDQM